MQKARLNVNLLVSIMILLIIAVGYKLALADTASLIKTDKEVYNAGEAIRVKFSSAPGSSRDWICIVAAGSSDNDAGDYKYMPNSVTQGEMIFDAPPPGKYEVRAYYNYSRKGYVVSARYSFSVLDKASAAQSVISEEKIRPVEIPVAKVSPAVIPQFNAAVFHFTPLSVDATPYGITVTKTLINTPKMQSTFAILDRKDLEFFLSANNLQQNDQIDSIIEIGTKLGLNFVIAGNIEKRGTLIVTDCKVVSIAKRNIIFAHKFISTGEANLISNVVKMSNSLIEAVLRSDN
jgi:hypothetical protein